MRLRGRVRPATTDPKCSALQGRVGQENYNRTFFLALAGETTGEGMKFTFTGYILNSSIPFPLHPHRRSTKFEEGGQAESFRSEE